MSYLAKAIWKLSPTAEFSFTEEDYSTIKWDVLEGTAPTKTQIEAAIEQIKIEETLAAANAVAAKEAAQAKLAALGLTTEDLKALGL
jgi:hypothetical protein